MADQALYVAHSFGIVVGSRQRRPWVAPDAEQAIATPWQGQPAFANAIDAFVWLDWARIQPRWPAALSVAHVDVRTDVTAEGITRAYVGPRQLREASSQILRGHPAASGPDERVLAACYGLARTDAARTWLIDQAGAVSRDRTGAAMSTVWSYGYAVVARDARAAVAGQVARTVRAEQSDLTGTTGALSEAGRGELTRLDEAASTLAASAGLIAIPDLPRTVVDEAREALLHAGELSGWAEALAVVWKHALRTGALDAVVGAAADIEVLWRTAPRTIDPQRARIGRRDASQWVAVMLNEASNTVASQWLLASSQPLPPAAADPHAATAPTIAPADPADGAAEPAAEHPKSGHRVARPFPDLTAISTDHPTASAPAAAPPTRPGRRR